MKRSIILLYVLLTGLVAGCSTTRVVLVPDPQGNVGEVVVSTLTGSKTLNQSGQSVAAGAYLLPPEKTIVMTQASIDARHGETLAFEPVPPQSYLFYFLHDSVELTENSATQLPEAISRINQRESCDMVSAGHTDSLGDPAYNVQLSYRRAKQIKALLNGRGIAAKCIEIISYGENAPLVKTGNNVSQQKNRRVELLIR
ncbi:MAG: OmpA family protein [Halopseudomonas sp.]